MSTGIVLGTPYEHLHDALDLILALDHGVDLVISGKLRQIAAVFFQRPVLGLGPRVVHPVCAAYIEQRLVDLLLVDIELLENGHGIAAGLAGDGDQKVLHAHVFVVQTVGLTHRRLQHLRHPGRRVNLDAADGAPGLLGNLGILAEHVSHAFFHSRQVDVQPLEDFGRQTVLLLQQGQEYMFHIPHGVAEPADQLL